MLVDDNRDDNFFHEREIKLDNRENIVLTMTSGREALRYFADNKGETRPDLILLDINMPGMNGWEFLEEYNKLDKILQGGAIVIMLTTSENPDDVDKTKKTGIVAEYRTKPLTQEAVKVLIDRYCR